MGFNSISSVQTEISFLVENTRTLVNMKEFFMMYLTLTFRSCKLVLLWVVFGVLNAN